MMLRYAAIRLLYGAIAFLAVTIFLFSFLRMNHPVDNMMIWGELNNQKEYEQREEAYRALRAWAGLDDPWVIAYLSHMGRVFRGDLGPSTHYAWQISAAQLVSLSLPDSLALGAVAGGIGMLLTLGLGVVGAAKPNSPLDYAGKALATIARASPPFVISILLLGVSAAYLGEGPRLGRDGFVTWVLPVTVLALFTIGVLPVLRTAVLNQLTSEHVKLARIKGLPEWKIVLKHALLVTATAPPAYVTVSVSSFVFALAVVEYIFAWPGLGGLAIRMFWNQDFFVLHAIALVTATALIALHVVVDIVLAFADPRVRIPERWDYALTATPAAP